MSDELVVMEKVGQSPDERLTVHRTCVKDHERLGWRVVPDAQPAAAEDPRETKSPRRGASKE